MNELVLKIAQSVEQGKISRLSPYPPHLAGQDGADEYTRAALRAGISPQEILRDGLVAGMKRVGDKFRDSEIFLPEVLMSARALSAGFEHLRPLFVSGAIEHKGTIVIGTVAGDLHDIGKKIVGMFFEGAGWNVVDLGVDVPAEQFLAAIEAHHASAVGLSTLLTTTMASMAAIARAIRASRPEIKIIVGGAPITSEFATQIGADAYFPDPQGALDYLERRP